MIPPLVYMISRCGTDDVNVLTHFFEYRYAMNSKTNEDPGHTSVLLYYLILFSEMWELPTPPYTELRDRLMDVNIASGSAFYSRRLYCAFSKEISPGCDEIELGRYDADGIIYPRDYLWNKIPILPSQASVLLMNGKLDPLTHFKYATSLFEALDTPRKKLILFDNAPHSMIDSTPFGEDDSTCGEELLASFVANNGDLERLDMSCIAKLPVFNMTLTPEYLDNFFGMNDAYGGA
uniref:Peptidase S33 tripeptidyl aminopeptidase-like C-terminal domain-containing protein n=1 Tax=Hyaloperonospora arabidopsidis (strain Emoy2) TaxID=559515 RepID=M4BEW5_HYAAE